jgi:hypothetical protein
MVKKKKKNPQHLDIKTTRVDRKTAWQLPIPSNKTLQAVPQIIPHPEVGYSTEQRICPVKAISLSLSLPP